MKNIQNKSIFTEKYSDISIKEFSNINFKGVKKIQELISLKDQKNISEITKNLINQILGFKKEFKIGGENISWTIGKILKYHKESNNKYNFGLSQKYSVLKEGKKLYLETLSDPLTGLKNKKFGEEKIQELINKKETNQDLIFSIIIIDIDYFKKINDTFGHQIGDKTLLGISKILQKNFRKSDTISRWGGEEFLIILKDTNNNTALEKAEKLRQNIEKKLVNYIRNNDTENLFCKNNEAGICKIDKICKKGNSKCFQNSITISAGVATIRKEQGIIESQTNIIKRADTALYKAKNEGRNKVINDKNI